MTTVPGGEPEEQPEEAETGVGWPGPPERPVRRSPERPVERPPQPPAEPPRTAEGDAEGDTATSHRGAAVRRFRQEIARDRAQAGSGVPSGAGVPPLVSGPPPDPRPPGPGSPRPRPRTPQPIVATRPGTVTAAAVILFVGAGLAVLGCCGVAYLSGEANLSSGEQNLIMLFSAILLGSAALNAVLGYYILQGRQWARVTAIVLCVLGVLGSLVNQFASFGDAEATGPLTTCVGAILNIVVISLLSGQQAGHYFRFANA